jgi:hypothetical protein
MSKSKHTEAQLIVGIDVAVWRLGALDIEDIFSEPVLKKSEKIYGDY